MAGERAQSGSRVRIHYRGTLDDGEVFDSNFDGEPMELEIGSSPYVLGALHDQLVGMAVGEEKTFSVEAEEAYGAHDAELVLAIPKDQLPADGLFRGVGVQIRLKDGRVAEGHVADIGAEAVTVDFNHPLAGKRLTFAVKVVDVR